jgi:hypothetical protein
MLAAAIAEIEGITPEGLKSLTISPVRCRPLKEAIVTVGGIALEEIDSRTMEADKVPGFYAVGEVLDVDGPTGGYNLHAAFSTARLAIAAIREKVRPVAEANRENSRPRKNEEGRNFHKREAEGEGRPPREAHKKFRRDKNAWGQAIWEGRTIGRSDKPKNGRKR